METPYSKAWDELKASDEYRQIRDGIDIADPYLENRIRRAFDAGWNARGRALENVDFTSSRDFAAEYENEMSAIARDHAPDGE